MRAYVALGLAVTLVAAPVAARAGDWSGCTIGPNGALDRCTLSGAPALALAAIAAPALFAGAAVTVAHELHKRTVERRPAGATPESAASKPDRRPNLALVPAPVDHYASAGTRDGATAPNPAVRFDETATQVGLAVGGAMVLGAIIANLAKKK